MTITAPVSLTKIKTEFGGPNNLSAYVRGGSYVPNTAANANVSATVAGLAISQFLGATNYVNVSASVSPTSISHTGTGTTASGPSGSSGTVTASGSGGSGSYTFSWSRVSGDTNTAISSATVAAVTFSRTGCVDGTNYVSTWRCLVSDGTTSAFTPNVTVTLSYTRTA